MRRQLGWLCFLPALASLTSVQSVSAATSLFASAMQAASQGRNVPLPLIEATAYVNSRWEWIATPAADGGVGPMHVMPSQMTSAMALSGHSAAQIAGDLGANLDAGAALLAQAHTSGTNLASWQPAVVATQGSQVATQIFDLLRSGKAGTAGTGEQIVISPQPLSGASSAPNAPVVGAAPLSGTVDCPPSDCPNAVWNPASPANYTVADRPHDYPVQMIIIHDTETSYGAAIQLFQDPATQASAHYVVSDSGQITQMVAEKDIAWHAGNWDYNTRAIGIEHEGYAYAQPTWYTTAMYQASAHLAASICSRWGVPMDRTHVIGHSEVPDPNNPGQFGGVDHHTDPGPYWDWNYYMGLAQSYASALPSPPHMMPDPVAVSSGSSATVTWLAAQTCHSPITGYTVTRLPDNVVMNLPATARSFTSTGLQPGVSYTFTVKATNADGTDALTAQWRCNQVTDSAMPTSPQGSGTGITFTASASGCPHPLYQFWVAAPGGSWQIVKPYSTSATFNWDTTGLTAGSYLYTVWAMDTDSTGAACTDLGCNDAFFPAPTYSLTTTPCSSVTDSAAPPSESPPGTTITFTASASGCPHPLYQFWVLPPGSSTWQIKQAYSTKATFTWTTTGLPSGNYMYTVWVRDSGSTGRSCSYLGCNDAFSPGTAYSLNTTCASVTDSVAPASPQLSGTGITFTASASGCPHPLYQFWILPPGSSTWQVKQAYSSMSTFNWDTSGLPGGKYLYTVWARDSSSTGTSCSNLGCNDAFFPGTAYSLTTTPPCTSVTDSAAPSSPQGSGTPITFTANATGCPHPLYQFWILPRGLEHLADQAGLFDHGHIQLEHHRSRLQAATCTPCGLATRAAPGPPAATWAAMTRSSPAPPTR